MSYAWYYQLVLEKNERELLREREQVREREGKKINEEGWSERARGRGGGERDGDREGRRKRGRVRERDIKSKGGGRERRRERNCIGMMSLNLHASMKEFFIEHLTLSTIFFVIQPG